MLLAQIILGIVKISKDNGIRIIDKTPSKIGKSCCPAVNIKECLNAENISMISCGGQFHTHMSCYKINKQRIKLYRGSFNDFFCLRACHEEKYFIIHLPH